MNKKLIFNASILSLAALSTSATAEDSTASTELNQVNVFSTTENSVDSSLNNFDTIELDGVSDPSVVDISSALEQNTSVSFDLDGNGNTRHVSIRGMGANNVEVTVDGIKKPSYFTYAHGIYNNGELNSYETDTIKQIDIIKGKNSPKQSGGALAGSINMRTYRPSDFVDDENSFYGSIKSSYASKNSSWANTATGAVSNGNLGMMVMYTKRKSHEIENQGNDKDQSKHSKINYNQDSLLLKGEADIGNGKFIATAEQFKQKRVTERRYSSRPSVKDEPVERKRFSLEAEFENTFGLDAVNALIAYQGLENTSQGMYIGYFKNDLLTASIDGVKRIDSGSINQELLFGLGYERTEFDFKRYSKSKGTFDRRVPITVRKTAHAYLKDNIEFGGKIVVSPGIRVEHKKHSSKVDDIYANNPASQLLDSAPSGSETTIMPSLGLSALINESTTVFANYSRGSKSADDVNYASFSHPPPFVFAYIPNPDLKDETSTNFELGFTYKPSKNVAVKVNGFYTKYDDFINQKYVTSYKGQPGQYYIPYNLDGAKTYGVEVDSVFALNDSLSVSLGATWMKGKETSENGKSTPLTKVTPLVANLGLRYAHDDVWGGSLRLRLAGKGQKPEGKNKFRTPGYGVTDVTAWWKPMKGMTISGGVYNVFDKTYWLASDVNGSGTIDYYRNPVNFDSTSKPGRNFAVSFKYEF